jgi:hypothetical protein
MAEPIKYVIVCGCTGENKLVAYLEDSRPAGGLSVEAAAPSGHMINIVGGGGLIPAEDLLAGAQKDLSEQNVTETLWPTGNVSWAIRCEDCGEQVQLSDKKLVSIADRLRTAITSGTMGQELPLGVLTRILSR